jgi:hypothetical protein
VKSTEVYSIIRQALASWCKEHGFRRTEGGMLGWYKPIGNQFIIFWFQVSRDGWDEYAGSKFIVEFQISDEPFIGAGHHNQRWRLPKFLNEDELEHVRRIQNAVIAKLEKPNRDYHVFQLGDDVVNWYLAKFNPIVERYSRTDDIWLRYKEKEDVKRWAVFVKDMLPKIVRWLSNPPANNSLNRSAS